MSEPTLYECPSCGHIDHDQQDGTGHWEQGTHEQEGYSNWLLACSNCGETSPMKESDPGLLGTSIALKRIMVRRRREMRRLRNR